MKELLFVLTFSLSMPWAGVGQPIINPAQASTEKPAATSPELSEANLLNAEAVRLHGQKKYDDALPLAKRALELREKVLGPDHELVATSLHNLAGIYRAQERYADAETLYKRALKILERKFGVDDNHLTDTIEQIGLMRFVQGNNGDAQKLYLRALAIKEKTFGPGHIETAKTLSILGRFFERANNPDKAVVYFKRSLAIREKALAPDHPDLAEALENCACALMLNDQVDDGGQYLERASKIRKLAESETVRPHSGFLQGSALQRVEPSYPAEARQRRVRGSVVVEVTLDVCGRVMNAQAVSGPDELRAASVSAARRWQFTPTRIGGRLVKVIGTITFNFNR
jgi:TonB family protein